MTSFKFSKFCELKAGVCVMALLAVLAVPTARIFAAEIGAAEANSKAQVEQSKQDMTTEKRKQTLSEAKEAIDDTVSALKSLDAKNSKEALSALQNATGKLEIILARDPALAFAPANVSAVTYDLLAGPEDVKRLHDEVESLVNDGRLQEARQIMGHLASETDILTSSIPLATYPPALKQAAKLIDAGKTEEAKTVLQTALNTVVVSQTVMPLPIVRAQAMLKQAETLAENKTRKPEQNKELADLLSSAETQIKFAQELGYGDKPDFQLFYDEVSKIRANTGDGKSGVGFFEKIKGYMSSMTDQSQPKEAPRK
ncbi:MAG: YfdX family protein [Micavibrio sp.]|nr:YfdX family protein [Micavibrio sp.]